MGDRVIKPERRRPERRHGRLADLGNVVSEGGWDDRRTHCWDLEPECTPERRRKCSAHFVQRNCWDLWAAEYFPPGRRPCCHSDLDCAECPVVKAKFGGSLAIYVAVPPRSGSRQSSGATGWTNVYCSFLYGVTEHQQGGGDGELRRAFRCQHRPGIQLHGTYVSEVCGTAEFRECIFYRGE